MTSFQPEHLLIPLLILFFICYLISRLGSQRVEEQKKKNKDPYQEDMNSLLEEITSLKITEWPKYTIIKPNIENKVLKIKEFFQKELTSLSSPKELELFEFKMFIDAKKIEEIASYEFRKEIIEKYIEKLSIDWIQEDQRNKHAYYFKTDSTYQKLYLLSEDWETALQLYRNVINEIDQAKSSISSAQTMETVDLFSKNKGISIASSLMNSSAQGEIDDIKPSLNLLNTHLQSLKSKNIELKEINSKVTDTTDLFVDLIFDFSFDFTSVFSLFALSSASSKLSELEDQLEPLGEEINSQNKKVNSSKNTYFNSLK